MKIEGNPKEIADLVIALQGQPVQGGVKPLSRLNEILIDGKSFAKVVQHQRKRNSLV